MMRYSVSELIKVEVSVVKNLQSSECPFYFHEIFKRALWETSELEVLS